MSYDVMKYEKLRKVLRDIQNTCTESLSEIDAFTKTYSDNDGDIKSFIDLLNRGRDLIESARFLLCEYSTSLDEQEINSGFLNKAVDISDSADELARKLGKIVPKEKLSGIDDEISKEIFSNYQITRDTLHSISEIQSISYVLRRNFKLIVNKENGDTAPVLYKFGEFEVYEDDTVCFRDTEVILSPQMKRLLLLLLNKSINGNGFANAENIERELRDDIYREVDIGKISSYVSKLRSKLEENNISKEMFPIKCTGTGLEARWFIET